MPSQDHWQVVTLRSNFEIAHECRDRVARGRIELRAIANFLNYNSWSPPHQPRTLVTGEALADSFLPPSPPPPHTHKRLRTTHTHTHTDMKSFNFAQKLSQSSVRLMRSFVTSIFPYACESWTLTAELQRRIQAKEMRCYRKTSTMSS